MQRKEKPPPLYRTTQRRSQTKRPLTFSPLLSCCSTAQEEFPRVYCRKHGCGRAKIRYSGYAREWSRHRPQKWQAIASGGAWHHEESSQLSEVCPGAPLHGHRPLKFIPVEHPAGDRYHKAASLSENSLALTKQSVRLRV